MDKKGGEADSPSAFLEILSLAWTTLRIKLGMDHDAVYLPKSCLGEILPAEWLYVQFQVVAN